MRQCKRCHHTWPDVFFRDTGVKKFGKHPRQKYSRKVCIGCELSARTDAKQSNRFYQKAKNALYHHAQEFIRKGIIISRSELVDKYGWVIGQMAHDIEHAANNGCPYCRHPFSEMPNGDADISLDIIDPRFPPYYRTNVRWVCRTCNSEKQRTPPDLWGEKLQCWEQWRKWQETLQIDEWAGTLFEGISTGQPRLI